MNFSCRDFYWVLLKSGDSPRKESSMTNFRYGLKPEEKVWLSNPLEGLMSFRRSQKSAFCCRCVPTLNYLLPLSARRTAYFSRCHTRFLFSTRLFTSSACSCSLNTRKTVNFTQNDILYLTWEQNVSFGKRCLHCIPAAEARAAVIFTAGGSSQNETF